ncbi:MAG TPA: DNA alkylation repair protein [Phycisphaerales bacterium]|nr:DNA alkylation repair protein [Phycisphaerales bacterium]
MTPKEVLKELNALGDEKRRAHNTRHGAGDNQFGVPMGNLRTLAKKIKADRTLCLALWKTGNIDAQLLAALMLKPKDLSADELDELVRSITFAYVADWVNAYIVKHHPDKEALRRRWMADSNPMAARAGWSLTADHFASSTGELDAAPLLDRIESEMSAAHPHAQWTMNNTLAQIGINLPKHRKRAVAIGEKLGVYRDYPVPKGCTSPFAPIWISEMVKRNR